MLMIVSDSPQSYSRDSARTMQLVFNKLLSPLPAELGGWVFYHQHKSGFHNRHLQRVARKQTSSCLSASSTLVSSWRKQKALGHESNSALTAGMFWKCFTALTHYTLNFIFLVLLRQLIPCMSRISTSAMSQHWKLQLSVLLSSLSGFMTSAMPTH